MSEFFQLFDGFRSELQATDCIFGHDHRLALISLQARLNKGGLSAMDSLYDSLALLEERLDSLGVQHSLIGGLASAAWGRPRLTRDVDVKIGLERDRLTWLIEQLAPDYMPLSQEALAAAPSMGILFVTDSLNSRIDLMLQDTEFDREVLRRSLNLELRPGKKYRVCTAEDLLIYKLISDRPQDQIDARDVVRRQGRNLDRAYLRLWLEDFERILDDSTLWSNFETMSR